MTEKAGEPDSENKTKQNKQAGTMTKSTTNAGQQEP